MESPDEHSIEIVQQMRIDKIRLPINKTVFFWIRIDYVIGQKSKLYRNFRQFDTFQKIYFLDFIQESSGSGRKLQAYVCMC